jgi:Rieske Fe-S protein
LQSEQKKEAWREDFPHAWPEDEYITRREFTRFLGLTSFALFLGAAWIAVAEYVQRWRVKPKAARLIAGVDTLAVGAAKIFHYPTADDPCILVRLASDRFVAYSQRCTHLSCPVIYEKDKERLRCPCHEGYFAAADGRVLAGPPHRPLPKINLSVEGNDIWIKENV